jgi:hypothetical protein
MVSEAPGEAHGKIRTLWLNYSGTSGCRSSKSLAGGHAAFLFRACLGWFSGKWREGAFR